MKFVHKTILILILMFFVSTITWAQKTDTLVHINGNVMTGEIKKMVDGILFFKMDGMGTISVEAEKIRTYKSNKLLQIRTKQGNLILGNIDTAEAFGYVKVGYGVNKEYVRVLDIIEVFPIKSTFWLRTSGNFDLGFDYAKSTGMARANTSGNIQYRKPKLLTNLSWDSYGTAQNNNDDSVVINEKADITYNFKRLIKGRWLWVGNLGMNSNSELGLDLRLYFGLNIQNDMVYTNRHHLFWQTGVSLNREFPQDGDIVNNPEALFSVTYNIFKHSSPKISLSSNLSAYPNLKFNGRWRLDGNVNLKVELFKDFYLGFNIYYNYDSRPPSIDASTHDYGFSFSIGYSFH